MRRHAPARTVLALLAALSCDAAARAQEKSGPQPGDFLPASFAPYNLHGPSKGLYHSLVCEFGLRPAVLVFVRERRDGKDQAVIELLKKLDEMLPKYEAEGFKGCAVILSPDAQSSVDEEKTEDVDKVLAEEEQREKLRARLEPVAAAFKHLVLATYPADGPKEYALSPKAEVTVIVYERLKVRANWAFREGQLDAQGVRQVLAGIEKIVNPKPKRP